VDTGELRRQILRALDDARRASGVKRRVKDEASEAYERFLSTLAAPLVRQAVSVLRAEGHSFEAQTPAGSARLARDGEAATFLEFTLDTTGPRPQVIGRVSVARGRGGVVLDERPVAADKAVADLTEADVAAFLVAEIPKLIVPA
jgi:hypothetical protein